MNTSLNGKTAIITGGSLGIGKAMAQAFYQAGARVAIIARRQGPVDDTVAEISAQPGGEIAGFTCDVADGDAIAATYDDVAARFSGADIVVNNAGKAAVKPFASITDDDWQSDIDLKLMAAVRFTRLAWAHMEARRWGRIINVLNVFAKAPAPNSAPTSVTRAAGMALTKVLAGEGAPYNILANAMLIGYIKSDQIRRTYEAGDRSSSFEEFVAKSGEGLPMGRMGEPEEAANLAVFLASDAASYFTGCAINMVGGLSKVV
jgi:NAD(P)-dependent dehydrogenase (short-subunit alcohol dehydrogenase family)